MPEPTFLGIGAMKAATTTVAAYLANHPEIGFPKRNKEVNWFQTNNSQEDYEKCFPFFKERGEFSVENQFHIGKIADLYPNIKVILCVRHPIERLTSAIRQLVHEPPEPYSSSDFVIERMFWILDEWRKLHPQIKMGLYKNTILETRIHKLPLLVLDFGNISNDQSKIWKQLTEFLGISFIESDFIKKHSSDHRPKYKIPKRFVNRLNDIYADSNRFMLDEFGINYFLK